MDIRLTKQISSEGTIHFVTADFNPSDIEALIFKLSVFALNPANR